MLVHIHIINFQYKKIIKQRRWNINSSTPPSPWTATEDALPYRRKMMQILKRAWSPARPPSAPHTSRGRGTRQAHHRRLVPVATGTGSTTLGAMEFWAAVDRAALAAGVLEAQAAVDQFRKVL
jgi:hypothetical protein